MLGILIGAAIGLIICIVIYRRRISKHLYVRKPKIKRMSDEDYEHEEVKYIQIETKYNTLVKLIDKKIIDLQEQLVRHYSKEPGFILHENDLLRYSAMIEILKTVKEAK